MSSILSKLINLGGSLTGTLPVLNGGTGVTTSTGTVAVVLSTSPTLVTPVLGAATATSLAFSPTTGGIIGTTTNDSAGAGKVGEYISSVIPFASGANLTNGSPTANITSISLTAGDWDVTGVTVITLNGAVASTAGCVANVTTTSASLTGSQGDGRTDFPIAPTSLRDVTLPIPNYRVSLSTTTTVYLVGSAPVTTGTMVGFGRLSARRMR